MISIIKCLYRLTGEKITVPVTVLAILGSDFTPVVPSKIHRAYRFAWPGIDTLNMSHPVVNISFSNSRGHNMDT